MNDREKKRFRGLWKYFNELEGKDERKLRKERILEVIRISEGLEDYYPYEGSLQSVEDYWSDNYYKGNT